MVENFRILVSPCNDFLGFDHERCMGRKTLKALARSVSAINALGLWIEQIPQGGSLFGRAKAMRSPL